MLVDDLLPVVKANLILSHDLDDDLLRGYIRAAISFSEKYQHREDGWLDTYGASESTKQALIMLASHFYESRDGSTAGFFADSVQAGDAVWKAVERLLRMDREWKV